MGEVVAVGRRAPVGLPHLEGLLLRAPEAHEGRDAHQRLMAHLRDLLQHTQQFGW